MNSKTKDSLSNGIRLFVCCMAVFFSFLAIVDSFQQKSEIVYKGEFVSEADFKFIELPSILQNASVGKISKIEKMEIYQPVSKLVNAVIEFTKIKISSVDKTVQIFLLINSLFQYSLNTNAP